MPDKNALIRSGMQAHAVVVATERHCSGDESETYWDITFRTQFDDGSIHETTRRESESSIGAWIAGGDLIPVRYDPSNHSRIEIDVPTLQARNATITQALDELTAPQPPGQAAQVDTPASQAQGPSTEAIDPDTATDLMEIVNAIRRARQLGDHREAERLKAGVERRWAESFRAPDDQDPSQRPSTEEEHPIDRLRRLADLHDRGEVTDAELKAEQEKILGDG